MAKLSDLPRIVKQALTAKEAMEAAGKAGTRAIVTRTRTGKGVRKNLENSHKLPALKEPTKNVRRSLKKQGRLTGRGATPAKSALNRSGELLDSVDYKAKAGSVEISVGKDQEKKVKELLKINPDYAFMNLSKAEFKRVVDSVTKQINAILRRTNINQF